MLLFYEYTEVKNLHMWTGSFWVQAVMQFIPNWSRSDPILPLISFPFCLNLKSDYFLLSDSFISNTDSFSTNQYPDQPISQLTIQSLSWLNVCFYFNSIFVPRVHDLFELHTFLQIAVTKK